MYALRGCCDGGGIQYIFSSCLREMCEIVAHFGSYGAWMCVCRDVWDCVSDFFFSYWTANGIINRFYNKCRLDVILSDCWRYRLCSLIKLSCNNGAKDDTTQFISISLRCANASTFLCQQTRNINIPLYDQISYTNGQECFFFHS